MGWWRQWRRRRAVAAYRPDPARFDRLMADVPAIAMLPAPRRGELELMAVGFLAGVSVHTTQGLALSDEDQLWLAARLCLPLLALGLDWADGCRDIVVYPDVFVAPVHEVDDAGVVFEDMEPRSGEAWEQGPMVLSWSDLRTIEPGYDVAIHEMAHKLDMRGGEANGFPPLHADMDRADWTRVFTAAYERACAAADSASAACLDDYAADSPAEFFAVASEAFFTNATALRNDEPDLYRLLNGFYRLDPAAWSAPPSRPGDAWHGIVGADDVDRA